MNTEIHERFENCLVSDASSVTVKSFKLCNINVSLVTAWVFWLIVISFL